MKLAPLFCAIALVTCSNISLACDAFGAYGINFGDKPDKKATKTQGGTASTWYSITPPKPDSRFDKYLIRVDTKTKEIFQIDAVRTIIPMERASSLTHEQRAEGQNEAKSFVNEYLTSLPANIQAGLVDEYNTSNWKGSVAEGILLEISANFSWDVTVSCNNVSRENTMGRRVLPEMFGPNK